MKKLLSRIVLLLALIPVLFSFACAPTKPKVIVKEDTYVVINVVDDVEEGTTLYDYMLTLESSLRFTHSNGMITSINGIENASDWSSCWMIYTTDKDNSNTMWGTAEYEGKIYGSASFGAESLVVKKGESYIWLYQSF